MPSDNGPEELQKIVDSLRSARADLEQKLEQANNEISAHEGLLNMAMEDMKRLYDDLLSAQSRLMQADKLAAIGLLAAGIMHEINNPMACVSGTISMLHEHVAAFKASAEANAELRNAVVAGDRNRALEALKNAEETDKRVRLDYVLNDIPELLRTCMTGLTSIEKIVKSLRTFSRSDKGVMVPEDIHAVIDSVIDIVWNQIKYKAELVKSYADLPKVTCNAQQIGQVFVNLLVNASHAIREDGKITLRTYSDDGYLRVDVEDTGSGIPPEVMPRIFETFFTTKEAGKGTGLGLSISMDIVKKHNGTLTVRSQPGEGTCFTVSLPLGP